MEHDDQKVYKISTVMRDGTPMEVHVRGDKKRREFVRMLNEEYGIVEVEEVDPADVQESLIEK
jgi:hypothetical protein